MAVLGVGGVRRRPLHLPQRGQAVSGEGVGEGAACPLHNNMKLAYIVNRVERGHEGTQQIVVTGCHFQQMKNELIFSRVNSSCMHRANAVLHDDRQRPQDAQCYLQHLKGYEVANKLKGLQVPCKYGPSKSCHLPLY